MTALARMHRKVSYFVTFTISLALISAPALAYARMCVDIFTFDIEITAPLVFEDPRENFNLKAKNGILKVGEGNSGSVYLFKTANGEFKVAKIYKPERAENLVRDHNGLALVQKLFDSVSFHNINFRVATSHIVKDFNGVPGQHALVMPYFPGFNLHKLLINSPKQHIQHLEAMALYDQLVKELDLEAAKLGIKDEFRPETERYFQDHIVDGLPMLIIDGNPRILIKTDNIIYNPVDHSLTLIDPY